MEEKKKPGNETMRSRRTCRLTCPKPRRNVFQVSQPTNIPRLTESIGVNVGIKLANQMDGCDAQLVSS